jgi:hypothetical protein
MLNAIILIINRVDFIVNVIKLSDIMLNAVILSVVRVNVILNVKLSVVMLNAVILIVVRVNVILNVIKLSVVAPKRPNETFRRTSIIAAEIQIFCFKYFLTHLGTILFV